MTSKDAEAAAAMAVADDDKKKDVPAPMFPSCRLLLGFMNCCAMLFLYLFRINLSLSLVCMVKQNPKALPQQPANFTPYNDNLTLLFGLQSESFTKTTTRLTTTTTTTTSSSTTTSSLVGTSRLQQLDKQFRADVDWSAILGNSSGSDDPSSFNQSSSPSHPILPADASNAENASVNYPKVFRRDATSNVRKLLSVDDYDYILDNVTSGNDTTDPLKKGKGEFEWNRQFQGYILSSYFYGYLVTQVLGGVLSGRYGAKHILGTGMLIQVLATLLTPVASRGSPYLLIALRIILGAAGGVFFPSIQSLWGPWAPPLERSFLVSFTFFGITLGNIIALFLSSQFCTVALYNGWPFTFYTTGGVGFIFWVCWNIFVYSSPEEHPRISAREREYIIRCKSGNKPVVTQVTRMPVPWGKILISPAVMAILCAQVANTWFTHTSITLPFYMKDVLKFDIKQNGFFLILPYLLDMVCTPFVSKGADLLRSKRILSTTWVRKLYQGTSSFVSSSLLLGLSFVDKENRYIAVGLLCLIYPFQNLYRSGYAVNPQDIAPKFAGEIFGITNTAATICGIVSPIIVGALTTTGSQKEWQTVFYISAGLFVGGGLIFLIFARGEIQSWAVPKQPLMHKDVSAIGLEAMVKDVSPAKHSIKEMEKLVLKENGNGSVHSEKRKSSLAEEENLLNNNKCAININVNNGQMVTI